jgi:hypothetical protein
MTQCPLCSKALTVEALKCNDCSIEYRGKFDVSPLSMLQEYEQHLAEMLIIHGGNLKEIAKAMQISYPTLKKRLTQLTQTYMHLKQHHL